MVYIGAGTKITDPSFHSIKTILQKGQKQLDAENESFSRRTEHENPAPTMFNPNPTRLPPNDEPRKILGYNSTRIHKETLQEVLEFTAKELSRYK